MTDVPFIPEEKRSSSQSNHLNIDEKKPEFKRPEFIVIDERNGRKQYTHFGKESSQQEKEEIQTKGGLSLRFLCLLGCIFCFVFGLGILVWSTILTFLATVSLFQNPALNQRVRSFWKLYMHIVVVCLGFTLGLISPTLGLGLIGLYFSLAGEIINNTLLRTILKRSFNNL